MLLIDIPSITTLLHKTTVPGFLQQLVDVLEEDYGRWPEFAHSPRPAYHAKENGKEVGVIELMPTSDGKLYSFKYVNGHPQNTTKGLLNVVAFGCLADVNTGYPLMIAEMSVLTALRTAGASAMAAKHMANKGGKQAIIGCGAQAEFQVLAMAAVCGLTEVAYYDRDPATMQKFAANLAPYANLKLHAAKNVADAVKDCQVVTTATAAKSRTEIVPSDAVQAGVHYNGIGGDTPGKTEFSVPTLQRCKIAVQYEPQTRVEGEIQQLPKDFPVTELKDIVKGAKVRTADSDITMFDSVGYALEDFSILRLVYKLACEYRIGIDTALLPEPKDPKDLFGILNT
ncbi:MAG: ornithine cyclodeaminase [Bdellovibrionales bacterium]